MTSFQLLKDSGYCSESRDNPRPPSHRGQPQLESSDPTAKLSPAAGESGEPGLAPLSLFNSRNRNETPSQLNLAFIHLRRAYHFLALITLEKYCTITPINESASYCLRLSGDPLSQLAHCVSVPACIDYWEGG